MKALPKAWLGASSADAKLARICAWCPDKSAADALALIHGLMPTHTICDACAAIELADSRGQVPECVRAAQVARDVTAESFADPRKIMQAARDLYNQWPATKAKLDQPGADIIQFDAGAVPDASPVPAVGPLPVRDTGAAASTPPAAAARVVFVNVQELAEVCGISAYRLHTHHKPKHWGVPHDWRFQGTATLYNLAAVPELVDELGEAGLTQEAEVLRRWWMNRSAGEQPTASREPGKVLWFQRGQMA
jgi:hypothetical protein